MNTEGPSADTRHPIPGVTRTGFLRPFITRSNIVVGEYTYYDDPRGPEHFEANVLYHFDLVGDRLVIGRYCSIAAEVRFIMNGGNHPTNWLSTFPFPIFGNGWEAAMPEQWPTKGDTTVGHDVWIGYGEGSPSATAPSSRRPPWSRAMYHRMQLLAAIRVPY